jgi:hypothetical protein
MMILTIAEIAVTIMFGKIGLFATLVGAEPPPAKHFIGKQFHLE